MNSINEIKAAHEATGGYWFAPDTLSFWDSVFASRVLETPEGAYFLSRETNPSNVKMWSVRYATNGGEISTVGEFFSHATQAEAWEAARRAEHAGITE